MTTRKRMMEILGENGVTFKDQPVLKQINLGNFIGIHLETSNVFMGWPQLSSVNTNVDGWEHRLQFKWRKYNQWLNQWYMQNSPGPHLSPKHELMTSLRASGWTEERLETQIERTFGEENG